MKIFSLILKEIVFRKLNFALIFFPVVIATAGCIMMLTVSSAAYKEVNRQMRDLGTNLIIAPKSMNTAEYFRSGFTNETLPEEYITKLSKAKIFTVQHLMGTIYKPIDINGKSAIVNGTMVAAQVTHGGKKPPMGTKIDDGKVYCGFAIAKQLNLEKGGELIIKDRKFIVEKIYRSKGNNEDVMIYMNLKEAQQLFDMPKQVNVILALQCQTDCTEFSEIENKLNEIKAELAPLVPEADFIEKSNIADIRETTRNTVQNFNNFILPLIFIVSLIWIALIFINNVKERKQEIGILRAIGANSFHISALFLCKAGLIGIIGGISGYYLGNILSLTWGPKIFPLTATKIEFYPIFLLGAVIIAPTICIVSSYLPAFIAVQQDPADVLREV